MPDSRQTNCNFPVAARADTLGANSLITKNLPISHLNAIFCAKYRQSPPAKLFTINNLARAYKKIEVRTFIEVAKSITAVCDPNHGLFSSPTLT
jgi:hypothetical protein